VIGGKAISCTPVDRDRYDRIVAACFLDGTDIGEAMVGAGLAFAYRQYSDRYVPAEARAKDAGKGFWRGAFVYPWDWRRQKS